MASAGAKVGHDHKLTVRPAGHAKDDGHSHAADDGHAGHRLLASAAPPSDDDAPIKCNVKEDDCDGHWYPPGYVSNATGCCHCEASCDHDAEWAGDDAHADDHHRLLDNPPQQGRRRPRAGASDQGQAQDRDSREKGRPAGRVRRREQGLGALRLSLPSRVASPSDARASIPLLT